MCSCGAGKEIRCELGGNGGKQDPPSPPTSIYIYMNIYTYMSRCVCVHVYTYLSTLWARENIKWTEKRCRRGLSGLSGSENCRTHIVVRRMPEHRECSISPDMEMRQRYIRWGGLEGKRWSLGGHLFSTVPIPSSRHLMGGMIGMRTCISNITYSDVFINISCHFI